MGSAVSSPVSMYVFTYCLTVSLPVHLPACMRVFTDVFKCCVLTCLLALPACMCVFTCVYLCLCVFTYNVLNKAHLSMPSTGLHPAKPVFRHSSHTHASIHPTAQLFPFIRYKYNAKL